MSYTDKLIEFAEQNKCPGCGPTLTTLKLFDSGFYSKYCICCGWLVSLLAEEYSFGNMPPFPKGEIIYRCVLDHPEHRARWPQPERIENQPDEYTALEIAQQFLSEDGKHYYLTNPKQRCGICSQWGSHKVTEERPNFYGHTYNSALCCEHFEMVFGPHSHDYERVSNPVVIEGSK